MKNHSNRILTVFFAVSLAISISLFFVRAAAFPFEIYGAIEICAFYFPAVPFLFLQMLLCKAVQKKWVRFLPLLAVAIVAMVRPWAVLQPADGIRLVISSCYCSASDLLLVA